MQPITDPSYRRIRRRTISLRKLDLLSKEEAEIVRLINMSFTIPTGLFPQKTGGKPIFRACINEDSNNKFIEEPFNKIPRISYYKTPGKYGRCNLVDRPVFYGADSIDVAASEVCNNVLNKNDRILHLTVGEWRLRKDILVSIVCHSKRVRKRSPDLHKAYNSLLKLEKAKKGPSEIRIWKVKNKFFSNEFSKEVLNGEEKKYVYSAIYSNLVLNTEDFSLRSSGLWYPSVAYRFYGHNVAYDHKLIDSNSIVLEKVIHVRCTYAGKKKPPKIEILAVTQVFEQDLIKWG